MENIIPLSGRVIRIELTEIERKQFVELCDVASRAAGIPAAKVAMPLVIRVQQNVKNAVEFTEDECNQIANLFHTAVQVRGLEAAKVALPLVDKISNELQTAVIPASVIPLTSTAPRR